MNIHMWIAKWFLSTQIRTISNYWKDSLECVLCPRIFRTTLFCDGTDVQADWRRSCTYGRAPNAIDIPQGSLTSPSYTDTGLHFFIRWFRHTAPFSRLLRHAGDTEDVFSTWTPRRPHGGIICLFFVILLRLEASRYTSNLKVLCYATHF